MKSRVDFLLGTWGGREIAASIILPVISEKKNLSGFNFGFGFGLILNN
jgi:hypothetical protein